MTYETINWELEAGRVARAFGVEGECEFREYMSSRRVLYNHQTPHKGYVLSNGNLMSLSYDRVGRHFYLGDKDNRCWESVQIGWDGDCIGRDEDLNYLTLWTKALYHLSLLTLEVEAALGVSISAHEKLEWKLEYEERYGEMD